MTDVSWTTHRAKIASLSRSRPQDDPELLEARRNLRAERLAKYIRETVDAAPPLTAEQRERLAVLLRGGVAILPSPAAKRRDLTAGGAPDAAA